MQKERPSINNIILDNTSVIARQALDQNILIALKLEEILKELQKLTEIVSEIRSET